MTTITHIGGGTDTEIIEWTTAERLMVAGLIGWVVVGPVVGIWYANHIIIGEWGNPIIPPDSSFFSNVMFNFFGGTAAWFLGIVVLGILWWRAHAPKSFR